MDDFHFFVKIDQLPITDNRLHNSTICPPELIAITTSTWCRWLRLIWYPSYRLDAFIKIHSQGLSHPFARTLTSE